jgi:hypothetical protein
MRSETLIGYRTCAVLLRVCHRGVLLRLAEIYATLLMHEFRQGRIGLFSRTYME